MIKNKEKMLEIINLNNEKNIDYIAIDIIDNKLKVINVLNGNEKTVSLYNFRNNFIDEINTINFEAFMKEKTKVKKEDKTKRKNNRKKLKRIKPKIKKIKKITIVPEDRFKLIGYYNCKILKKSYYVVRFYRYIPNKNDRYYTVKTFRRILNKKEYLECLKNGNNEIFGIDIPYSKLYKYNYSFIPIDNIEGNKIIFKILCNNKEYKFLGFNYDEEKLVFKNLLNNKIYYFDLLEYLENPQKYIPSNSPKKKNKNSDEIQFLFSRLIPIGKKFVKGETKIIYECKTCGKKYLYSKNKFNIQCPECSRTSDKNHYEKLLLNIEYFNYYMDKRID